MPLPRALAAKLGKPIRLLASDSQGEALAALCAIARLLESYSCSFHTLADHVENANGSGLSEDDKQKIRSEIENARAAGYAEGVRAAEAKQHGTGAFRNTDGTLEWTEVALYCQREKHMSVTSLTAARATKTLIERVYVAGPVLSGDSEGSLAVLPWRCEIFGV